jgi:addiction module HigA family antidote
MPMKNPPHPGEGLKDDLDALGLTVAEAAKALAITRQQLYKIINGESGISAEMAIRLEQVVGGSAGHWLRLQAAYDLAQARMANQINLSRVVAAGP